MNMRLNCNYDLRTLMRLYELLQRDLNGCVVTRIKETTEAVEMVKEILFASLYEDYNRFKNPITPDDLAQARIDI